MGRSLRADCRNHTQQSLSFLFSIQELKECFASRSIPRLQEVLAKMPKEESAYHMKRCIDSGLWVPDAKAAGQSYMHAHTHVGTHAHAHTHTHTHTHTSPIYFIINTPTPISLQPFFPPSLLQYTHKMELCIYCTYVV